ncbi:MAG: hypothetical protein IPO08_21445 [Xanthomonadales bacterium]|nr:hypothetical protein [Xanthomonadales bacterium]
MANTILTPTAVTRKAAMILHQKLNFIGSIDRQYDDSFARKGAKIGDTLKIRMPNEYTVRTGMNMSAQNTSETSVDLTMATVKGVDMNFTSDELTLDIDDFSERIIEPAMSVLAANIEADALSMRTQVYNLYDGDAAAFSFTSASTARQILSDNLAPMSQRTLLMNTGHSTKFQIDTKGLFHDSEAIKKQYRDGIIGRTAGFENIYENTLLLPHQTGTAAKTTSYTISGAVTTNGSVAATLTGAATTFKAGDVFTVAGCYRVHPETKVSTGVLQQFVVTADCTTAMTFTPALYTSGPRQNVVAAGMANSSAVVKVGAGASETLTESLVYHKSAFAFVTADLPLPEGVDWARREVVDGISVSLVRDFQVSDRSFPCRLDVLYGYKAIRPQLAARIHNDA